MSKSKIRERSRAAFAELDREIEKLNKSGNLKVMRDSPKAKPSASKAKSSPKAKSAPPKQQKAAPAKQRSESKTTTKQYDDSVTKTTTTPKTINGRKVTETKTVSSGTVRGGKSDNPELQAISDYNKMRSKWGDLIRAHGKEVVRNTVKGGEDEEMFNRAFPPKKKKK